MSDETRLPPSVGRLDPVVEAIRDGKRGLAEKLLHDEFKRRMGDLQRISSELENKQKSLSELTDFSEDIAINSSKWIEARKACGWSGSDEPAGPDSNHLSDFRVLKTAIEIIRYCMNRNPDNVRDWDTSALAVSGIEQFVETVRHWHGLKRLKPYRWGGSDRDCLHLIDDAYDAGESSVDCKPIEDMIPGFEGPVETLPLASREQMLKHADAEDEIQGGLTAGCQPALKAEELPIGTVMVLGGKRWKLEEIVNREVWDFRNEGDFPVEFQLWATELQELINRGVRFEISKGGA